MPNNVNAKIFVKVTDRRGQPILGLWNRNGRYYLQTQRPGAKSPTKIALRTEQDRPVADVKEAQAAIERYRRECADGVGPVKLRAPGLADHVTAYLAAMKTTQAKTNKTLSTESGALKGWIKFLGNAPLTHITTKHLTDYAEERKKAGMSNRTVNVDVLVLSNCLRFAQKQGVLRRRVTEDWEPLPYKAPKRQLRSMDELRKLCAEAVRTEGGEPVHGNGQALADYLKLMAFCGARRDSALAIKWEDVYWDRRQLWLRKTKYAKTNVYIDMNQDLEAHLKDMFSRRVDSPFLFPSSVADDLAMVSLQYSFEKVRKAVGLEDFGFHDLRHMFVSRCVMAGIDFMQIAKWCGHSDGGILIGRVYGHLTNAHGQAAAAKLSLDGNQPPIELGDGIGGNVQAPVEPKHLEPAGLAPSTDRSAADADAAAKTCEAYRRVVHAAPSVI